MKNFTTWRFIPFVLILMLAGCRESAQPTPTASSIYANAQVDLRVESEPTTVGRDTLIVTLTTSDGQPIDGASVSVRGDMTHAGMQPVFGIASESENGVYRVPFTWSMGGDWILTVASTLPDGSTITAEYNFTVSES